jgi:hypothetical protein
LSADLEVILAQDQGVSTHGIGMKKGVEAEFGVGDVEGTLLMTNKRLVFACMGEVEDELFAAYGLDPTARLAVIFTDVVDITKVHAGPPNIFIPIAAIKSVKGGRGGLRRPSLEVRWADSGGEKSAVFSEVMTGRKGKNLADWASVIEGLKAGKLKLISVPPAPSDDTLQGKVALVLSDMQEKGLFEIEENVESRFKADLDPDEVQVACDALAANGFLRRYQDSSGNLYYRKASPLGEDDLSS